MKLTLSWLQKYFKTKKSLNNICERLTMLGIEVAEVIDNQNFFKQFKIAEVTDVQEHPNADRLKLCKVNDGKSYLNIVTSNNEISILNLQAEGKNPMTIQQFLQGNKITNNHRVL